MRRHAWVHPLIIASAYLLCILLHYPDQFHIPDFLLLPRLLGLRRHALERILFVFPPVYAAFVYSRLAAFLLLGGSLAAMTPRVLYLSEYPADALLETLISAALGSVSIIFLAMRKQESLRKEELNRLALQYSEEIDHSHEEERRRIARELHDETIQNLIAIARRLEDLSLSDEMLSSEMLDSLGVIRTDILNTASGVRDCIRNIHSPILELLGPLAAVREFIQATAQRTGISMETELSIESETLIAAFPGERGSMFFRIIQEAVRNAVRHAETERILICMEKSNQELVARIRDYGKGIPLLSDQVLLGSRRLGILGMRERARLLGGTVTIHSPAGGRGTEVTCRLPLPGSGDETQPP